MLRVTSDAFHEQNFDIKIKMLHMKQISDFTVVAREDHISFPLTIELTLINQTLTVPHLTNQTLTVLNHVT